MDVKSFGPEWPEIGLTWQNFAQQSGSSRACSFLLSHEGFRNKKSISALIQNYQVLAALKACVLHASISLALEHSKRDAARPPPGYRHLTPTTSPRPSSYTCLPVRFMIHLWRKSVKNPSFGENSRTNKKVLIKDNVNKTSFMLIIGC